MEETKCLGGLSDHKWGKQFHQQDRCYSMGNYALAIPANIPEGSYKYMEIKFLGNVFPTKKRDNPNQGRVYNINGLCPVLNCMGGGNLEPHILEVNKVNRKSEIVAMRGREKGKQKAKQQLEKRKDGCTNSITTAQKDNLVLELNPMEDGTCRTLKNQYFKNTITNFDRGNTFGASGAITIQKDIDVSDKLKEWLWEIDGEVYLIRIRKLTPKECYRLMGFSDEDFEKAESVNSNTQLYKQAGNSIVKNVLMGIFYEIFKDETEMNPCLNCNWNCDEEDKKCNEYYYVQKLKSKERE